MKKILLKIMLAVSIMVLSISSMAMASPVEDNNDFMEDEYHVEGTPNLSRWSYTSSYTLDMGIENGTAIMDATVTGYSGITTKIEIYFYLQQYYDGGWKNYKTWKDTVNDDYAVVEHTYSVPKGYKYRLRCSYYVYSGRSYDHFMDYSYEVNYY
ncbi:hypothetical protein HNP82_000545 [Catenibacillus scindens]|uniref:F5/8 type C domain-containing protein n=1 Tax=Catenibacillus scindens TaxID=673271 RepID=A0A7W8H7R5_9FIRM|nr:hypothetical protein [Catenibacillus scindens]MBB5263451.1 hypothetical protein [Catenibacillus scindens]